MTRPIMKIGLLALGRPCSIREYAQTASNPCPSTTQSGSTYDKVGSNTKGDQSMGLDGQPSTAEGVSRDVDTLVHAPIANASGPPLVPLLRDVHFIRLNIGDNA